MNTHRWMKVVAVATLVAAGCTNELQQARLETDECRLELQALKARMIDPQELARVQAQRDRLEAQNQELKRLLTGVEQDQAALRQQLTEAQSRLEHGAGDLETRRRELEQALANVRNSRQQWEEALAERQRQIDMLTSEVARLRRQIAGSRPSPSGE